MNIKPVKKGLAAAAVSGAIMSGLLGLGAQQARADAILVDRGLPTDNLNNVAGASRSNVAWADGDLNVFYGDTVTFGGPTGAHYHITGIKTWVVTGAANNDDNTGNDTAYDFSADFSSVTLYTGVNTLALSGTSTGNFSGPTATDNANITIQRVLYNDGAQYDYQGSGGSHLGVYEVSFTGLNIWANEGDVLNFAVDALTVGGSKPPYWFNHASNAALSGSLQQSADNVMRCFNSGGTTTDAIDCGAYDSNGNGWDKSSDINVQVYGHQVPEPGTFAILGVGLIGLGFARRRKAA